MLTSTTSIALKSEQLRARWPSLRVVDIFLYLTVSGLAAFLNNDTTAQD